MNEITTGAMKAKTAKHMTDSFGLSKNAMPKLEVPAEFREMIDKGVAQARDRQRRPARKQPTCSKPPMRPPPRALQATISS
jgi:hypothetical protein